MVLHVLPLAILTRWRWLRRRSERRGLAIDVTRRGGAVIVRLSGAATERHVKQAISNFFRVVTSNPRAVTIDVANVSVVDARFLGLLLILWKLLRVANVPFTMTGASRRLRTLFRLQGVGYLLSSQGA
jgi:N-acetylglucosaminyldiphosphoundecaprenol N-acetyl-beta-D-mannosaminyltransferase